mmetsp:Transcript_13720/g.34499  ORF Transcript_13720/g.34499 Transcript_13720/m.34499 type:complete len:205 (-) Transcript_13720:485-1099(-)
MTSPSAVAAAVCVVALSLLQSKRRTRIDCKKSQTSLGNAKTRGAGSCRRGRAEHPRSQSTRRQHILGAHVVVPGLGQQKAPTSRLSENAWLTSTEGSGGGMHVISSACRGRHSDPSWDCESGGRGDLGHSAEESGGRIPPCRSLHAPHLPRSPYRESGSGNGGSLCRSGGGHPCTPHRIPPPCRATRTGSHCLRACSRQRSGTP